MPPPVRGRSLSVARSTSRGEKLQALFGRHNQPYLEAEGGAKPGNEQDQYSMYVFGAQFAEVRVDALLGQMRVSRMVGAFGAGRILNARTARSQFTGGMVWGIGLCLYEDAVMDERLGRFVNNNLLCYHHRYCDPSYFYSVDPDSQRHILCNYHRCPHNASDYNDCDLYHSGRDQPRLDL